MWEGDDLDVRPPAHLLFDLQQGLEARELGVGDVGVGAHVQDALGRLPTEEPGSARHHVLVREALLALGPDLDPLEERS